MDKKHHTTDTSPLGGDEFEADSARTSATYMPTELEKEAWAQRERNRRKAWVEGPTEEEKAEWACYESQRRRARRTDADDMPDPDDIETIRMARYMAQHIESEWDLIRKGACGWALEQPLTILAFFRRQALAMERSRHRPYRSRRVPFPDDDY